MRKTNKRVIIRDKLLQQNLDPDKIQIMGELAQFKDQILENKGSKK
jgi:hypothetical protein